MIAEIRRNTLPAIAKTVELTYEESLL